MNEKESAASLAAELIAIIRVNTLRRTWADATIEQVDEFLVPWIERLAKINPNETKSK